MTPDEIKRRDWVATYPTREAALALIEWLKADDWESVSELDRRLAGIDIVWTRSFNAAAERCFEVYGYPDLEAAAVARRVVEVTTRPIVRGISATSAAPHRAPTGGSDDHPQPLTPVASSVPPEGSVTMTYGFTPRH
ncbi:MAG: hypothetical protein EOS73_24700 [Mesorhizobium sp.]|uniref:hypothetical protein n=1 Tax=Mesorhizobium sp. M7A.F.Ca.ET.027.02.1.1 TaxID=2496655 RepID=UPI000FD5312F|nr:hypothetical protein [Mesorhizobium sp. M7A.F.Ca.ET.027.02.1.1]RVD14622.1 hypothetical protein EN749_19020 [Mesorhizobium sp. M7A.F.Ca.ET.027.02.1.1]RWD00985.1 MAG: hypothetical protein EOS73_24700 [Mesorhizobium sp.]